MSGRPKNDAGAWHPCRLRSDGSMEEPSVHDNFVYALTLHLEKGFLILHTEYRDEPGPSELVDVRFVGCLAHHFDDVAAANVLFDIDRMEIPHLIERAGHLFMARKNYCWPLDFEDLDDLSRKLIARGG